MAPLNFNYKKKINQTKKKKSFSYLHIHAPTQNIYFLYFFYKRQLSHNFYYCFIYFMWEKLCFACDIKINNTGIIEKKRMDVLITKIDFTLVLFLIV